jgi:hypothetical protein
MTSDKPTGLSVPAIRRKPELITKAVEGYRTPKAPPILISKLNAIGFEKPARINRRCGDREKDGCAIFSKTINPRLNSRRRYAAGD